MTKDTIKSLAIIPYDLPVVGLMRHAERDVIPKGELGNQLKITQKGIDDTLSLHTHFNNSLIRIYSSPVLRCLETAQFLSTIAKYPIIQESKMLGDPGIFVEDPGKASQFFLRLEPIDVTLSLLNSTERIPGFCVSVKETVHRLLTYMLQLSIEHGVNLFITHDSILGLMLGFLYPEKQLKDLWPDFLETLFVYKEENYIFIVYRGQMKCLC